MAEVRDFSHFCNSEIDKPDKLFVTISMRTGILILFPEANKTQDDNREVVPG